ncbi:MAG: NupC/NupG family nucleoside CNT transporter [Candidatus Riflebacteria bacterium HGW-Riflebacteria-2]|jgi:CNT family concentrative nucleoside transporter|nr:MAG: NupC/NupG family nucleoside CNT transporter [Candidatus Riflebacteria bacterium HGW-Riflebacteria-2]
MERFVSLIGIPVQIGICYALSTDRKKINWKLVGWGIALQLIFAILILKTPQGEALFGWLNDAVVRMLSFSTDGAKFIFGELVNFVVPVNIGNAAASPDLAPGVAALKLTATTGAYFAFNVLPTIIFFSSFMAILYHLGIMQRLVYYVAMIMQKTMKTSGAESLSAAANIFVGQTEAPLVIKPYVDKMTFSELCCIMSGGMATIAGGVMAAYVGMLKDSIPGIAGHLIAASVMSAPAALVFAKILVPETEVPVTSGSVELRIEKIDQNVIDAAARGCSEGMSLALNVAAMLIGFIAMIAMGNHIWKMIADAVGITSYNSIESIIGLAAAPFAWLLGIPTSDIYVAGELLGKKLILNEFVAYADLSKYVNGQVLSADGVPVQLAMRSKIILSYALCGFANLGSIGIQLGGIGGIAPARRGDLAKLAFRALLAGSFACFLTANIAGILIE